MKKSKGIDISYWQGNVDFKKAKESGIDFVILREGYGQTTDDKFFEYVKKCKEQKLPIKAVYHFSYAINTSEVKKEARYCVKNIEKAGLGKDIIVFYDFEYDTVSNAERKGIAALTRTECNAWTNVFCEEVKRLGYTPGVYFNLDFYKNWYEKETLNRYVKWLADYSGDADIPCTFHQYCDSGVVSGISGSVDMNYFYEKENEIKMGYSRQKVVDLAKSWRGKKGSDGSHKEIIDIYNSYNGTLPRNTKMQYDWDWCAAYWSAIAIKLGYTDIMPIEISCGYLVEAAKIMGCWVENDSYVPTPGDAILYDWDDSGSGDNAGWPDHVGVVTYVNITAGYIVVMEGNCGDEVKPRTISINGRYIRGFIVPKYDDNETEPEQRLPGKSVSEVAHEVITGLWGNGETRKNALTSAGYDYNEIQTEVNKILNSSAVTTTTPSSSVSQQSTSKKVTATAKAQKYDFSKTGTYKVLAQKGLHLRNDAGTNKKSLVLIPYGTKVNCYGYYTPFSGSVWLYIQVAIDGVLYTGFSYNGLLMKI